VVLLLGWDNERRDFLQRIREAGAELRVILVSGTIKNEEVAYIEDTFGAITIIDSQTIRKGIDFL
jgi:hypothetical protein